VAQLDEVVLSHQTTFSGLSAVLLAAVITLLQIYTAVVSIKRIASKLRQRSATKVAKTKANSDNTDALDHALWQETNPNHK
jgi:hypothetical protein